MKVVVIGAGVAGLSIGWRLAQAGAEVVVLERARPGRGATWASAGMINVTPESGDADTPMAELCRASGAMWPGFAAEIEEMSGADISFRVDGAVMATTDEAEAAALAARADGGKTYLSAAKARALEPLLAADIAGALFDPSEAQVDNRMLGSALAAALVNAGGRIEPSEAVVRLEVSGERVIGARTPFAAHHGDVFVLAAGAWTSRIEGLPPGAMPPVIPVKGEMLALASQAAPPKHIVWGNDVYLVPRHGRLMVGATVAHEGFDTATTPEAADWLLTHATKLMPALASWGIAEQWAGLRPGSPDDFPILGATAIEGLFVASGQFRNGILLAPAIAEALCRLVLGHPSSLLVAPFTPLRFRDKALLAKDAPLR